MGEAPRSAIKGTELRMADRISVRQLAGYLTQQLPAIREQLLSGTGKPQPVKRVETLASVPDPHPGRRGAEVGHPDGVRAAVGPDVFRQQLWFSAPAVSASGGGA